MSVSRKSRNGSRYHLTFVWESYTLLLLLLLNSCGATRPTRRNGHNQDPHAESRTRSVAVSVSFFFKSHLLSPPLCSLPPNRNAPFCSLPPNRNADPGSRSRLFSPRTHYGSCLAFVIARRFQLFLASSTRVELCSPTVGSSSFYFSK